MEESIYPYLVNCTTTANETWIIGKGGQGITVNSFYANALLPNLSPCDAVLVPEAPVEVLENLGELLHTGRLSFIVLCR